MDDNTRSLLSDLIVFLFILCCVAGCVTCHYFDKNCDKNCKSKTEQIKSE